MFKLKYDEFEINNEEGVISLNVNGQELDVLNKHRFYIDIVEIKNNMMFIFLSNRVFPHRWNKELMTMNIRPKIQNITYEAMKLYEGN